MPRDQSMTSIRKVTGKVSWQSACISPWQFCEPDDLKRTKGVRVDEGCWGSRGVPLQQSSSYQNTSIDT